ncbi:MULTISPECIES: methylated-DNA--[protein]-cysteine S-methyltransferase [Aliivibrio]|uniref:Methylated-DNA--protein-cysteine methyltransferase n=1 Tax=Aliivibrio logei 5S-186 TaxID=626086 RepID=A0ABX3AU90_ALILO|nr:MULTISPECIES: methylated-DNA--[protein]-cysteine S-methyltransferase [Aliivibrio]MBB1312991.1 methylated-DNA--[protein]-cysteine S-methyltransferase [Aliivibrio sp. SR45-2]OEF11861.1 cysteine methyltransferase [Aliivibrio logei 5S-186]
MNVYTQFDSPIGLITVNGNDDGLLGVWYESHARTLSDFGVQDDEHPILQLTVSQLKEYFNGERREFSIPLAANGTEFQNKVWQALTTIPYGETWCYKDLAIAVGNPKASQAVGGANGKNPISIIVPCHRVIGKNGSLTGYAGGLDIKDALLKLEGVR